MWEKYSNIGIYLYLESWWRFRNDNHIITFVTHFWCSQLLSIFVHPGGWGVGRCMVEIHIIITFITLVITYIICVYMGRGVWHKSNYCGDRSNYPKNYFFARITSPIEPPWWRTYHLVPIDTPPSPLSMLYPAPPLPHPSSLPDPRPPPAQWRHLGGGLGVVSVAGP